ncbi:restriction endonuclease subunit S [Algoriphagus aquimarinus]|uniref:Restriction endonuclease subunit S n=1 Tax=Algoriphagus aquimarinus TaxID=237018 RepID=A0A5C7AIL0_9BACT|nr:restriction endonuclease subunit S [Algoriphagus aquimarinus]TXE06415.1 restriction endonuclease subunit S [Algoriphagus aquimarinus]
MNKTTFQKHSAYKDSGVEWLGEIPEHWKLHSGLRFISENKSKNTGMVRNTVLSLSYGKIRVKQEEELTGLVPESFETYQLVNKGDLIFRPTDLQNDKVSLRSAYSDYNGIITNAYLNLKFRQIADSRFYHYFFRAIDNNKIIYGLGSGLRQNISYLDFRRFIFPFPPKEEQTAIAAFLDDKTTKIDKAIAQKEQLIALLKERKQIIIQNAVTKGLDPHVRLKESGVEWIGQIPEHWEVTQIRKIASTTSGSTPQSGNVSKYYNGHIPWVRTTDLNNGELFSTPVKITDAAIRDTACKLMPENTVCVAMYGGPGTIGKHSILRLSGTINQALCGILPSKRLNHDFLYFYVKFYRPHWMFVAKGSRVDPNISQDEVGKMFIPLLPVAEQISIVQHIKTQSTKIDQAISLQQIQIEKLKEYKATLIDSAVTGKIKVT